MNKLCCFNCPKHDYEEKNLFDLCPQCGKRYDFPLVEAPPEILGFKVLKPLGRGFYAATYIAEQNNLFKTKCVLKVSPKAFYLFFPNKDFEKECETHNKVATGTEHIVQIQDAKEVDINFGGILIPCNISQLEYINGELLAEYLNSEKPLSAEFAAQVAIDLFRIISELAEKGVNHNDLHSENIIVEKLPQGTKRSDALEDSIRAKAIDLGSITDGSRSDSAKNRLGDLHQVGVHLSKLVRNILADPDKISDRENRLASALQLIVFSLSSNVEYQRTPTPGEFIQKIKEAFENAIQHWKPWKQPLVLKNFSENYNAQTMNAWHVPQLLVDQDHKWLLRIKSPGPQIITGMRGCGKTMLLRALQFHARAAQESRQEQAFSIVDRIKNDGFIGLFVSAQRLLDPLGVDETKPQDHFARLFVAYGLESVRAALHLHDLDVTLIIKSAHEIIAKAISENLKNDEGIKASTSLSDLEANLTSLSVSLSRGDNKNTLMVHPNTAFPHLADAIKRISPIWESAHVLFLLDDVSTRYLKENKIGEILTALVFQSTICSFKLTSEAQTIELGLKSPGQNHPARPGRDLNIFDLGAEVYEKIKQSGKGNGKDFVESILRKRANHYPSHPRDLSPKDILGDVPLSTIASEIANSSNDMRKRKAIYRGLTALARVCVGDIGDVISLYEQIVRKKPNNTGFPISPEIQSECFQDFCARRLYDLNRRGGYLKDIAKSFAEASYELLVKSQSTIAPKPRLRQYCSLYVRITTGNLEKQTNQLRELIDAGVFVFAGGSNVPRAKTRDSNPTQQFKLTYRKIYGLVNFIGLSERDRFELSGSELEEWLNNPTLGKEILMRNLGGAEDEDTSEEQQDEGSSGPVTKHSGLKQKDDQNQLSIFQENVGADEAQNSANEVSEKSRITNNSPIVNRVELADLSNFGIDTVVIGLGFEERTLVSAERILSKASPKNIVYVKYPEPGKTEEIKALSKDKSWSSKSFNYGKYLKGETFDLVGNVLIDITGLAKPVLYKTIRDGLRINKRIWICHTGANEYYPLDSDISILLNADEKSDHHSLLTKLTSVLTGEEGPYTSHKLLTSDSDVSRQRALLTFTSAKHERLLSLLDKRDYDRIELVIPSSDSPRDRVAKIAAEVAKKNFSNTNLVAIGSNDMSKVLDLIVEKYQYWYVDRGLNFEFGLTGSKLQAAACAIASSFLKISQSWYIKPRKFDVNRFTKGVGKTKIYSISIGDIR